ncbi:hypothetical protein WJ968_27115 [Achromobacter xylosoxidans]
MPGWGGGIGTQTGKLGSTPRATSSHHHRWPAAIRAALASGRGRHAEQAGVAFASGRADLYAGTPLANTGSQLAGRRPERAHRPAC